MEGVPHLLAFITHVEKLRRVRVVYSLSSLAAMKDSVCLYNELTRAFQVSVKLLYQIWNLNGIFHFVNFLIF